MEPEFFCEYFFWVGGQSISSELQENMKNQSSGDFKNSGKTWKTQITSDIFSTVQAEFIMLYTMETIL